MLAASKVKMSGSEKITANMNTGDKILGKHMRQFLHKNRRLSLISDLNGLKTHTTKFIGYVASLVTITTNSVSDSANG